MNIDLSLILHSEKTSYKPPHDKTNKMTVHQAKT